MATAPKRHTGLGRGLGDLIRTTAPEPEQAPVEEQAAPAPAPVDTDSDGVADNADKCASTPAGVQVDADAIATFTSTGLVETEVVPV